MAAPPMTVKTLATALMAVAVGIAGIFMDIAGELSRRRVGRALHLERTDIAVELGGAITKHAAFVQGPRGMQHLVIWADVNAPSLVPAKVPA